ncbi:MAG: VCBS repeat-containing protein [Desulfuromonadales bacterium]|nr:VCBS repeat-containing protein [Desulfuromonadales bacterium]MDW7757091.1 VCBS repeat-containing protein [Desulfuromonadales bacterium]
MDVVVGSSEGVGIFYQNLAGGLDAMVPVPATGCSLVRVGDVTGDSLADIVCLDGFGSNLTIIPQTGVGGLGTPQAYPVDLGGWNDLEIGDVNGDSLTDVIAMSGQGYLYGNIAILLQNGSGGLESPVYYDLGGDELTDAVGVGDVNNDGLEDVVVTVSGNYRIFYQNGSGTLDSAVSLSGYGHAGPVDVADIDGDGLEDIVSIQSGWEHLEIIRQQDEGFGFNELYLAPFYNGNSPHSLAVGDIDNNGKKDVVRAEPMYGLVVIYDSVFNGSEN